MNWVIKTFTSSIGQKFIMAVTGLFLITFLIVHCFLNALIFLNDGGVTFNKGAEFMATNPVIRIVEVVLFVGLILHIIRAYLLMGKNNKSRPVKYAVHNGKANSKWYSRSMGLLGTLLLMFLIIHLKHFWVVSRFTDEITSGKETLFNEMKEVFENPIVIVVYILAMFSLAYHLMHGFQSAFQTLGFNHKKYTPFIKGFGWVFSIIIPLIFALMPLAMHFNFIK
jgi:succinate dehydrogenase / fumarate reductase, cytochrome b subunit